MDTKTRLDLFAGMVGSCHDLYLWTYDSGLNLLESNCPQETIIRSLFSAGDTHTALLDFSQRHSKPVIMTNEIGMMWVAMPEKSANTLDRVYVLGPFFTEERSSVELEAGLRQLQLSHALRREILAFLRSLPIININRVFEYTIMLYYCVTGEKLSVSELHYRKSDQVHVVSEHAAKKADVHGTYEMEQEMVRRVREGDLNFQSHMNRLAVTGAMGKLARGDATRQMKNAVLVCIVLFSRAAIEGGVSPETAMTLTDQYFQSVEGCRTLPELTEIATTMQNDFVQRVHRARTRKLSVPVMECCDYINLHLEDALSLKDMADRLKYSEYYLSRKFRQELGVTFKEYVRRQRLERAKAMLRDSSLGIRDISELLHFCSPSYFAEQFKAEFGISPTQWRNG